MDPFQTSCMSFQSPLPSEDIAMKVTKTKVQLISLIADFLLDHFIASENKLVITSANDCPEQTQKWERIVREDMKTTYEEVDVIIPQQVMYAMKEGRQILTVRADNTLTQIYLFFCATFIFDQQWTIDLFMGLRSLWFVLSRQSSEIVASYHHCYQLMPSAAILFHPCLVSARKQFLRQSAHIHWLDLVKMIRLRRTSSIREIICGSVLQW